MDKNKTIQYYKNGCSCSQAIIRTAIEEGLCPEEFYSAATAFSGGMSSGCICGVLAAGQMVAGFCTGAQNAKQISSQIVEEFKKRNKFTCCRILSQGLEGAEKKLHCSKFVSDMCEIIDNLIKAKV